jgi:hypothetical protein
MRRGRVFWIVVLSAVVFALCLGGCVGSRQAKFYIFKFGIAVFFMG